MPDSTNPQLDSVVSIANASIRPKILTSENFEVISVQPFKESTSTHNTLVTVKIDLGAATPLVALPESDRYAKRDVKFTRIDLKDIAAFRAIEKNAKGQYVGDITDVASAIALLNAEIGEDEIVLVKTADSTVVKAVETSLGYIGSVTFAGASETEEPETPLEPAVLTALLVVGPATMIAETETTFSVQPTPAEAEVGAVVWTASAGLIDNTGVFVAPAEAGNVAITVSSGDISTEHVVTVMGNA